MPVIALPASNGTLLLCVLIACATAPAVAQDTSRVLTRGRAGNIAVGMPEDSLRRLVRQDQLMELTNCTEKACLPALGIVRGTEPAVSLGFRVSRSRATGEERVEVVIVRDSASAQPKTPGCAAQTPPKRRLSQRAPSPL